MEDSDSGGTWTMEKTKGDTYKKHKSVPTGESCSEHPTCEKSLSWSLQLATHLQILSKAANPSVTTFRENHSLKQRRWAKIASGRLPFNLASNITKYPL